MLYLLGPVLSSFLLIFSVAATGPNIDNCDYYTELESAMNCGPKGYFQSFALPYCKEFLNPQTKKLINLDTKGKKWLEDVRLCLQEKLVPLSNEKECRDISNIAFDSHLSCYVETDYCDLSLKSKAAILTTLSKSLLTNQVTKILFSGVALSNLCHRKKKFEYELSKQNVFLDEKYIGKTAKEIINSFKSDNPFKLCRIDQVENGEEYREETICDLIPYIYEPTHSMQEELKREKRIERNITRRNIWLNKNI